MSSRPFPGKPAGPQAKGPLGGPSQEDHACELNRVGFKATPSNQLLTSPHESVEAKCVYTDLEQMSVQLPLPGSNWVGENQHF